MADDDVREDEDREQDDADESGEGDETEASSASDASGTSDEGDGDADADDGESEGDDAPAPSAATAASAAVEKAKKAAVGKASAGARLAAAKAAKAAKKAAKKQAIREAAAVEDTSSVAARAAVEDPDAEAEEMLRESPLGRAATQAGAWAEANRQLAIGVAAAIVLALAGWGGWNYYNGRQAAAAGTLLEEALRISAAPVVTAGESEGTDDGPSYDSSAARNEAALAAYRRVVTEYPSSAAAAYARLGEGRTLLEQGEYDGARTAYEAAFHASANEPVVAWQSLEGIAATYEAQENWAEATSTYERLQSLNDGAYADVAAYHLARMHAAQGDETAALTAFRELVDRMREHSADDGEPPFPYVLAQAEVRLHELDPSAPGGGPSVHGGGGGGEGNPLEGLTPEQIQELIQRFQTKSGGSGAAPE